MEHVLDLLLRAVRCKWEQEHKPWEGALPAQTPSSWAIHTLLDFMVGWVWQRQGSLAWQPAVHCSQHPLYDKQFHLEPRNPRKSPLLNATKSFYSPGQSLCKYNESIQLRKGDVPQKLNTADPWEPGKQIIHWAWGWPLYFVALQKQWEMFSSHEYEHWGQLWTHSENWDRSVYCHPQIHSPPTLPKTNTQRHSLSLWADLNMSRWDLTSMLGELPVCHLDIPHVPRVLRILCENKHQKKLIGWWH